MSRKALIQIRRGLEKDISTLAIGELGYCEDTKKLYIGTKTGNVLLAAAQAIGDMFKTIYDTNNNGKVDIAEVADKTPWNGITDKPSTFPPSAHTHTKEQIPNFPSSLPANGGNADALNFIDNRNVNDKPRDLQNRRLTGTFKYKTSVGNPPVGANGSYVYILNIVGWNGNEESGGWPIQLACGGQGLAYRQAVNADNWGNWIKVCNISDIPTKLSQLQNDSNYLKKGVTWNELKGV